MQKPHTIQPDVFNLALTFSAASTYVFNDLTPLSTSRSDAAINLLAPRSTIKTCERPSVAHLSWSVRSAADVCGQLCPISLFPLCCTSESVSFPGVYLAEDQAWRHSFSVGLLIETVVRTDSGMLQ